MMSDWILLATEGGSTATQGGASAWGFLIPVMIVLVVMTFISGRSQKKQRDKQKKMYESIVKGCKVRTIGGFTAKVLEVREDSLLVELADKMPPVELVKNAVAAVLGENNAPADAAKK